MRLSVTELLSDLSADGTTIALDMPGGGYDRLHDVLERHTPLPRGKAGRAALVAVALVASRLVKQQLGVRGPIANFFSEITEDAVREQAKRILETVIGARAASAKRGTATTGLDTVWDLDSSARSELLQRYRSLTPEGQQQMRTQMLRSTATELAMLAGMSHDDLATLLDILAPHEPKRPGMLDRFATELFPWLKEK